MFAKLVWRQSTVSALLRCPRRVYLEHVLKLPQDHEQSGYANWKGTADHAVAEFGLKRLKATGKLPTDEELAARALEAFEEAVVESEERGIDANPDGITAAMDALVEEHVPRMRKLLKDPRLKAIHWRGLEVPMRFTSKAGRKWSGTIDAVGVALRTIPDFGVYRGEPVTIYEGEEVVVDWKTGTSTELGWLALDLGVQLGIYGMMLQRFDPSPRRRRYFIAHVRDVDPYSSPPGIKKHLPQEPNPAWLETVGLPLDATVAQAKKVRKRPKDDAGEPIEKWLQRINPEWEAARSKPRGPVFYEARPAWPTVAKTVNDAMRMADAGIWPASGALTGQCPRCPYARHCASANPTNLTTQRTENDR